MIGFWSVESNKKLDSFYGLGKKKVRFGFTRPDLYDCFAFRSKTLGNMKMNHLRNLAGGTVLLISVTLGTVAQGQSSINGTLAFVGSATLNGNLGSPSATDFSLISATVQGLSQTANYSGVVSGTAASFSTPFYFSPASLPAPLWNFTVGSTAYSFTATSLTIDFNTSNFLEIQGAGTAHIDGFTDTPGTWSITGTSVTGGPRITFGASIQVTPVPEPSAIGLLLGFAPVAWVFRRVGFRVRS